MRKEERTKQQAPLWMRLLNFLLALKFRQIILVFLTGILCAGLALTATKTFMKPIYASTVTIAVMNERAPNISHIQNLSVCYQLADSLAAAGRNQEAAANTISRLGIEMDVNTLLGKVHVSRKAKTMLVRVRAVDSDPLLVQQIAQAYSEEMLELLAETLHIRNPQQMYGPTEPVVIGSTRGNTVLGGLFGCFLMLCLLYRRHRSSRIIRRTEDLALFEKPVIGEISGIRTSVRGGTV